jgi:hypothetical protein
LYSRLGGVGWVVMIFLIDLFDELIRCIDLWGML